MLLSAGLVRFANPTLFNDPLDCVPRVQKPRPVTDEEWERAKEQLIASVVELCGGVAREKLRYVLGIGHLFDTDPFGREQARKILEKNLISSIDDLLRHVTVYCLAESGEVPLMWSHYARGHRGICLIFSFVDMPVFKVNYSDRYPIVEFPLTFDILARGLLTKPDYWHYEGERRIIAVEPEATGMTGVDFPTFQRSRSGFVTFSPTHLVGVILGCRISESDEAQARKILASASHPIEIWKARPAPDRYVMIVERES